MPSVRAERRLIGGRALVEVPGVEALELQRTDRDVRLLAQDELAAERVDRVAVLQRELEIEGRRREGVVDVRARFGFMETPDVGEALRSARRQGLDVYTEDSSFFLGWHLVRARPQPGLRGVKARAVRRQ